MGVYLSKPVKEKISSNHENSFLKCGASSMQGWRMSQEDAHNCCVDFDSEVSLFAVYDGHGGAEVAEYASRHLPDTIKSTAAYKSGDFDSALKEAFLTFDSTLTSQPVIEELKKIAGSKDQTNNDTETEDENEEEDVAGLREEAKMPLPDVIARYANGTIPKTPALKRIASGDFKSPYLRARSLSNTSTPESEVSSSRGEGEEEEGGCPASSSSEGVAAPSSSSDQQLSSAPSSSISSQTVEQPGAAPSSSSGDTQPPAAPPPTAAAVQPPTEPSSSSSSSAPQTSPPPQQTAAPSILTNGEVHSNGETLTDDAVGSTSGEEPLCKKEEGGSSGGVSSSSGGETNGPSPNKKRFTGTGRRSAEKARQKMFRSLLAAVTAADSGSDSDEENDESFSATAESTVAQSSEEEEEDETGGEEEGEEDEEEGIEEGEEEVEEEEEEEGEEEVDLSRESDEVEEPGNDSGCTAVVSLVTKNRVVVANAGDSRAVLCRSGTAVDLSVDHKPEDPEELSRITAAGGRVTSDGRVNGGLNLSRALGDHLYKKNSVLSAEEQMITALPDIKSVELREAEDEFIVLACDGIWNSMSSQEVVDFVRPLIANGEKLSEICEKLFDSCLAEHTLGDGTGCDNMTCVLVQLFPGRGIAAATTGGGVKRKSAAVTESSSSTSPLSPASAAQQESSSKKVKVDDENPQET